MCDGWRLEGSRINDPDTIIATVVSKRWLDRSKENGISIYSVTGWFTCQGEDLTSLDVHNPNPYHTAKACDRVTSQCLHRKNVRSIYLNVEWKDTSVYNAILAELNFA